MMTIKTRKLKKEEINRNKKKAGQKRVSSFKPENNNLNDINDDIEIQTIEKVNFNI